MVYIHKDGTGSLFANTEPRGPNSPNANGRARIGGRNFWVSAWTRISAGGVKYQSLSFLEDDRSADQTKPRDAREGADGKEPEFDDGLPF
jgi:hypothetical protein